MIHFAPAKINLGLHVLEKREDGYHNLQTVMVPTGLCDLLEITTTKAGGEKIRFEQTGISLEEGAGTNLCVRAWELMSSETRLPPLSIHLHKQIPVGAGLGGGSSDGTHTLTGINNLLEKQVPRDILQQMAASLGSDCPFFLHNGAMLAEGRGEILTPVNLELSGFRLVLFHPGVHISTAEAYGGIRTSTGRTDLRLFLEQPVKDWKNNVENDFEPIVFDQHPRLREIKASIYAAGASYASLSGSGSAMYGLFTSPPVLSGKLGRYKLWEGPL